MGVKSGFIRMVAVTAIAVGSAIVTPGFAGAAPSQARETLIGIASITGAPTGWLPSNFYLQLCPAAERFSMSCTGQRSGSPNQSNGSFNVEVPASAWKVGMYYYTANGQIILNKGLHVKAEPGATIHLNVSMSYVVPAVAGVVHLTGAPSNFGSLAYMGVQACPARVTFAVGCRDGSEAYEDIGPGSSYLIDLAPGSWNVAAYYRDDNNLKTFSGAPVTFRAKHDSTREIAVTIVYQGT